MLIGQDCAYCGVGPGPFNGIDRTDNSLGYFTANVISCCATCNNAKGTMSVTTFKAWAISLYQQLQEKQ